MDTALSESWQFLRRDGDNLLEKFAEVNALGLQIVDYLMSAIIKEAEMDKDASRWKAELLKKGTESLGGLAKSFLSPTKPVTPKLPTPLSPKSNDLTTAMIAANRTGKPVGQQYNAVDPAYHNAMARDAYLRVLGGKSNDVNQAMEDAVAAQYRRGTIGYNPATPEIPVTEIPYNPKTTAFRGFSGGASGRGLKRQEYPLPDGDVFVSIPEGGKNVVFYGARPEISTAYAKDVNNLVDHGLPFDPFTKNQKFIGRYDVNKIDPSLQVKANPMAEGDDTDFQRLLWYRDRPPWSRGKLHPKGTLDPKGRPDLSGYESRTASEQFENYLDTADGNGVDYELVGKVKGIRPENIYRMIRDKNIDLSTLSPQGKERYDQALQSAAKRYDYRGTYFGDSADPQYRLQEVELAETPEDVLKRVLGFLKHWNG
jgi:hypothetical protein